jgi:hypothetical protein
MFCGGERLDDNGDTRVGKREERREGEEIEKEGENASME